MPACAGMKDILDALVGKGSYDGGGIIIGSVIYDDIFKIPDNAG